MRLSLLNRAAVEAAYDEIMENAAKVRPIPKINGVLVQPMVSAGLEMMVGAKVDGLFGPLVIVSLGGVMVELLKDSAVDLAPVTPQQARRMLKKLKGYPLLRGYRGSTPVNEEKLCEVIQRVSELASDQRHVLKEIDVNPLICRGDSIIAVDGLIVK